MNKVSILSDTNCELNESLRKRFGVEDYVRAHLITPDKVDHPTDLDWNLYPDKSVFYRQLRDKKNVFSTSPASPDELILKFEEHLKKGEDVIFLSISKALSGTYNFALMAKKEIEGKYPNQHIAVIDTMRYSVAIGMLVASASLLAKEGKSFEEIVSYVENNKNKLHQMGPMDDLFYLSRKGRISHGKAFMGTLIGVKPLGDFNDEGMTTVLAKVVGIKAAIETTVEYVKKTIVDPGDQIIWIAHTDREKSALLLKERIEEVIKPKETIFLECGPSTAVNTGPGLSACFYFGKEISEGLKDEQAIINQIIEKK